MWGTKKGTGLEGWERKVQGIGHKAQGWGAGRLEGREAMRLGG